MKNFKNVFALSLVIFCSVLAFHAAAADKPSTEGKKYFTRVNIWYAHPLEINTVNFHQESMLPVGTAVTITKYRGKVIEFTAGDRKYRIVNGVKYSDLSLDEQFKRYFSESDPMAEGGEVSKFTKLEQDHIKAGSLAVGMSKEAAVIAYGYPPSHRTDIASNKWLYWINRINRVNVTFVDNKIFEIKD